MSQCFFEDVLLAIHRFVVNICLYSELQRGIYPVVYLSFAILFPASHLKMSSTGSSESSSFEGFTQNDLKSTGSTECGCGEIISTKFNINTDNLRLVFETKSVDSKDHKDIVESVLKTVDRIVYMVEAKGKTEKK